MSKKNLLCAIFYSECMDEIAVESRVEIIAYSYINVAVPTFLNIMEIAFLCLEEGL